ncbi:MAG: NAD(P)/FAD-dependent oxidoreductase [Armatimonadota bacterium]
MRVAIIGAGPAGTVCALALLRGAQQRGQQHDVLIIDGKSFTRIGPQGCNMCAGVISTSLLDYLGQPADGTIASVIQQYIGGHYFESQVGGVHIPKESESTLVTVFRSAGPRGDQPDEKQSFDYLLLNAARALGARHIAAHVADVAMPTTQDDPFKLATADGQLFDADVLIGAFGVNSVLAARFERLGFGYRRPRTYHVSQAELPLDPEYIASTFGREIKIFSLGLPGIRFGALTPKRRHVTVTVIGRQVVRADLERFLRHPSVLAHFPPGWQIPERYCHCYPQLPVSAARNVVSDRVMIVGDANISRYLKGGIESAFFTGTLAAEMVLAGTLTRRELQRGYVRPCHARYYYDNMWGKLLFWCNDIISRVTPVTSLGLTLLRRELEAPAGCGRVQAQLLWHIFTGDAPYRHIALEAISPRTLLATLRTLFCRVKARPPRTPAESETDE